LLSEVEAETFAPTIKLPPPYKDIEDLIRVERLPTIWCPGCGIGIALKWILRAIKDSAIPVERHVLVGGIGCTARAPGYVRLDSYHVLHGRAIPFAIGLKLANPSLEVTVIGGDGDILAIGMSHFIHAARRNHDLNVIIINNFTYGMTGGQIGPTTPRGSKLSTAPYGSIEDPVSVPSLALAAGATFVARWTILHYKQIYETMKKMIEHKGFAVLEIISPCVLYAQRNGISMLDLYELLRRRSKYIENPKPEDLTIDLNLDKPIAVGVFRYDKSRESYEERYYKLLAEVAQK